MTLLHTVLQVCRLSEVVEIYSTSTSELQTEQQQQQPCLTPLLQSCVRISEHPMAHDQSLGEVVSITQVPKRKLCFKKNAPLTMRQMIDTTLNQTLVSGAR